jgi:hypothetical protein
MARKLEELPAARNMVSELTIGAPMMTMIGSNCMALVALTMAPADCPAATIL